MAWFSDIHMLHPYSIYQRGVVLPNPDIWGAANEPTRLNNNRYVFLGFLVESNNINDLQPNINYDLYQGNIRLVFYNKSVKIVTYNTNMRFKLLYAETESQSEEFAEQIAKVHAYEARRTNQRSHANSVLFSHVNSLAHPSRSNVPSRSFTRLSQSIVHRPSSTYRTSVGKGKRNKRNKRTKRKITV